MKLQQIKLSGFKSFVDSTVIEVHGQLVGIVGPNGCGKSNVIDAVRWVLGESSAKQLRGESMADVIFNGSLKRKPVSRASVELVFDNSQKALYGLWNNYNEISIKRLISRQGESSYYINNQQVRRKDIAELFLGTGVGSKGYAVIEQGMISRIIESRPEDMRLFIEEAAGVSKYRERRKETLQRLDGTQENLIRLSDIQGGLLKQLASLQEQAKVAELYQKLHIELKTNQTIVTGIRVRDANQLLNDANQFIQHCEDELKVLGYQLEEINGLLAKEQEKKAVKEQQLQELMQQFNDYRTALARVEERFKHYSDLLKRFESEAVDLAAKQQELAQDMQELLLQEQVLVEKIAANQEELGELEQRREEQYLFVEDKQNAYVKIAAASSSRRDKLNHLQHDLDLVQNSLNHKRQQQGNMHIRQERLRQESHTLDFDQNYHFIKEEIELLGAELLACEASYQGKLSQLDSQRRQMGSARELSTNIERQLAASEAKISTLKQLLVVEEPVAKQESLVNIRQKSELWQEIQVEAGYELAVEVALGQLLRAKIISNLSEVKTPPLVNLGVWLQGQSPTPASAESLSARVTLKDPQLHGLYYYLNKFKLISPLSGQAELALGEFGVTRDGHLLTRDYVIFNANINSLNLLVHKEQLSLEQVNCQSLHEQLVLAAAAFAELESAGRALGNEVSSLEAKSKRLNTKKHDLFVEFTKQEQIFVQNQRHQERIQQELLLLEQEINHVGSDIAELEIQVEDQQIAVEELQLASNDMSVQKLESETALNLARNKLQELDASANRLILNSQLFKQQKINTNNLRSEKSLQLQAAEQKLVELGNERVSFNSNDQAQEILELQQQIAMVAGSMQAVQQDLDELENRIISLKNQAGSLNNNYQRNLEKINQTKFKQQEQQILLTTFQENQAGLSFSATELSALLENNHLSLAELSQRNKELEQQMNDLGLVNLKAIEDLAQALPQQQELLRQIEDLQTAIVSLTSAIEHIDSETRKLLQATFDQLNAAIVVYFRTLFGGGDARLSLTDKDILVAGVQIFAEPPGKKNSTIHLLSGGEKALAAMSFIFALFSLNPAPFCLLDEVDAPLDDANTSRFCKLVQELASKTQFVYISHNRLAMEMADQLVGVTMQEKGVSSVVSVSLVEAVKHAAAPQVNN